MSGVTVRNVWALECETHGVVALEEAYEKAEHLRYEHWRQHPECFPGLTLAPRPSVNIAGSARDHDLVQ